LVLGLKVIEFRVLWLRVQGFELRVYDIKSGVKDLGFRIWGLGFGV
jgi:hypothetical protein